MTKVPVEMTKGEFGLLGQEHPLPAFLCRKVKGNVQAQGALDSVPVRVRPPLPGPVQGALRERASLYRKDRQ